MHQKAPVPQHLQLLPYFVPNVPVVWMQSFKFTFIRVNILIRELFIPHFNEAIHKCFSKFEPPGLKDFIEAREAGTRVQAFELISQIEATLKKKIVLSLKNQFTNSQNTWWFVGVPKNVRKKVDDKINESDGAEGDREQNLDLIHYREIVLHNWSTFGKQFGYGSGNPKTQTGWLVEVNNIRKYTDHHKERYPTLEEVKKLREYNDWLQGQSNASGKTGELDSDKSSSPAPG
jgi:hypothetical protein